MRKALFFTALVSLALLFVSCASSEPGPVSVIGTPEDLVTLTGEWVGTYESGMTGRNGNITFHLTENPEGAHGDVLMVPKHELVHDGERHHQGMISSSGGPSVLSIELVRISAGEISGKIAPYADPEVSGAMLETHFSGRIDGEWIEGTFVTYSDHGVSPRRGTWRVHRKPVV